MNNKKANKMKKEEANKAFWMAITDEEYWVPSFTKISKKTRLAVSTVFDKFKRLKETHKVEVIIKVTPLKEHNPWDYL